MNQAVWFAKDSAAASIMAFAAWQDHDQRPVTDLQDSAFDLKRMRRPLIYHEFERPAFQHAAVLNLRGQNGTRSAGCLKRGLSSNCVYRLDA
jgi:hypothetical protein